MSKILITYASKTGTTEEIAEKIGEILKEKGISLEVKKINEVKDVSSYEVVILGTGVRIGKVFSESVNFLKKFKKELENKKLFYFLVCLTICEDTPENRKTTEGYLNQLSQIIKPEGYEFFPGRFYYSKISPIFRSFLKKMKIPEGDFVNWDKVISYANSILNKFK